MLNPSPPKAQVQRGVSERESGQGKLGAGSPRLTSQLSRVIAASQQQYGAASSPAQSADAHGLAASAKLSRPSTQDSRGEQDLAANERKQEVRQGADDSGVALTGDEAKEGAGEVAQATDESFVTDAGSNVSADHEAVQESVQSPRTDAGGSGKAGKGRGRPKGKGKAQAQVKVSVATRRSSRGQQEASASEAAGFAEDTAKAPSSSPVKTRSVSASAKRKAQEQTAMGPAQTSSVDQHHEAPAAAVASMTEASSVQITQALPAQQPHEGSDSAPATAPSGSSSPLKKQTTKRKDETIELAIGDLVVESEWNMSPHFKQLELVYTDPDVKFLHYNWTVTEAQANRRLLRFSSSLDTATGCVYVAASVVSQEQYLLDLHANGGNDFEGSIVISVHFATGLFSNKRELEIQRRVREAQAAAEQGQPYTVQPPPAPDSYFVTHYDLIRLVEKVLSSRVLHILGQTDLLSRWVFLFSVCNLNSSTSD